MAKAALSDKEYQTLSQFRYQLRRFLRFSEQASRRHGITHLQYLLLLHIRGTAGSESATVGELAEKLQAHHHGVVALITRCEKEGWVIRRQGRTDRREVEVLLTAQGKRLLGKVAQLHRDELLNLEGSFRVPEVQDLLGD
ncbi:MAG: MarR family transcriptional regulator [Betaproteobacteria bacterium]|nr:MarR family transcriptional regulator [Betaproteobacteria bacterium]